MILIIEEPITKTIKVFSRVLRVENNDASLTVELEPSENVSNKESKYKKQVNENNKNIQYVLPIINEENEDETFDTMYKICTNEGVILKEGVLEGFKE